ncbi:transglutaminase-like domain-containing protein [Paractinoplanes globisporus]|uniref:Transglutaminase-like domain-containing protein n=1 Tax=Paractinoplanes globisporus TaxID=113565 RepID=A0ABW6WWA3_9ACTN|nr:transglutaminase domain-containing protein [Actinoplanes globisporus]
MTTLGYYAEPGPLTTAGPGATALAALPSRLPDLAGAVRGLLTHEAGSARSATGHLRATRQILDRILAADPRPLTEPRPAARRLAGCCRHFTLVTVAALRAHGIPARARCGFARYFTPGRYGDHWVVEYWNAAASRWALADSQLSPELCQALGITFDPGAVPREQFVVAGDAWIRCRTGDLDPARCGLEGEGQSGWWWIAGNLVRDVAALAKMELLPWDMWGCMPGPGDSISDTLAEEFDQVATLTADPATATESRARYDDERFRVPAYVHNFVRQTNEPVFETI